MKPGGTRNATLNTPPSCLSCALDVHHLEVLGVAAEDAARKAQDVGMKTIAIFVKGPGAGRESALRAFQNVGMRVTLLRDVTPIPHNGCRPPKRRRV